MTTLRCVIVDDEPIAIDILKKYIAKNKRLELIAACKSARECQNVLKGGEVDILFLDIEMPGITGLQFLKSLENAPMTIFTTAHREFALEGYELDVVDYLLKPIPFARFEKSINKACERFETKITVEGNQIFIKSGITSVKITIKEIVYVEGMGNYIKLHLLSGKSIVTYRKMSEIPEIVRSDNFLRIHRSYFVALDKVSSYTSTHVCIKELELPIGISFKTNVKRKLDSLKENT